MTLSTVLLICAIADGLLAGITARYRRWGTSIIDLLTGLLVAILFAAVVLVVLTIAAGLDRFGLIHFIYLLAVVSFPIASAWIVLPHLIDAERRTPIVGWLLLAASASAIVLGLWATHVEPFRLQVEQHILGAEGANEAIVVGVISDLQATSIGDYERSAAEAVLDLDPDIILLPGDLFQLDPDDFPAVAPGFVGWLRTLTDAVDHVILVNGNVDDAELVSDLAAETGATYLHDEISTIKVRGQSVTVIGLATTPDQDPEVINEATREELRATTFDNDLVLALSHYPDVVLSLTSEDHVDLLVSGHTHGGQISLPRIGPLVTFSNVPDVVAAGGLHLFDGQPVYVSTGVGLERGQAPQVRFGVPPSVAVLTIVPG